MGLTQPLGRQVGYWLPNLDNVRQQQDLPAPLPNGVFAEFASKLLQPNPALPPAAQAVAARMLQMHDLPQAIIMRSEDEALRYNDICRQRRARRLTTLRLASPQPKAQSEAQAVRPLKCTSESSVAECTRGCAFFGSQKALPHLLRRRLQAAERWLLL